MLAGMRLVDLIKPMRFFFATEKRVRMRGRRGLIVALGTAVLWAAGGCQSSQADRDFEPIVPQFLLEASEGQPGTQVVELPVSEVRIPVYPRVALPQSDVRNVELVKVDLGLCLLFEFTPSASRSLLRLSSANLGRRLVVTLNGRPMGARVMEGPIADGRLFIFVELPEDQLPDTAVNLKKTVQEIQAALQKSS